MVLRMNLLEYYKNKMYYYSIGDKKVGDDLHTWDL